MEIKESQEIAWGLEGGRTQGASILMAAVKIGREVLNKREALDQRMGR